MAAEPDPQDPYAPPKAGLMATGQMQRRWPVSLHVATLLWLAPWLAPAFSLLFTWNFSPYSLMIPAGVHAGFMVLLIGTLWPYAAIGYWVFVAIWIAIEIAALVLLVRQYRSAVRIRGGLLSAGILTLALVNAICLFVLVLNTPMGFN